VVRAGVLLRTLLLIVATASATACGSTSSNTAAGPSPAKCSVTVTTEAAPFPPTGGNGTVAIGAARECSWAATPQADWIALAQPANGRGDAALAYTVQPNLAGTPRKGGIDVSGNVVEVTQQAAPCRFSVKPERLDLPAAETTADVTVQGPAGCAWNAATDADWLSIAQGAQGAGPGTVRIRSAANDGPARQGSVSVAGVRVTVAQSAAGAAPPPAPPPQPPPPEPPPPTPPPTCTYALAPNDVTAPASGGTGASALATGAACTWTAASDASWLAVTSPASGTGSTTIAWRADLNPDAVPRAAHVTVAGQVLTVRQDAAAAPPPPPPCQYDLSPADTSIGAAGGSRTFSVHTGATCDWTAVPDAPWVTVTAGAAGQGDGTVTLVIAENVAPTARVAVVRVAGQEFTVRQDGLVGQLTLSGDITALDGACPGVSFAIAGRTVRTSPLSLYVRGSCTKLKNGRHVTVVALPAADGGLDALEVTFDADLLP
jgi:hypothetical protein